MAHASNIVFCQGPEDPHAFDIVPLAPRKGSLDAPCQTCRGHGQWNREIDLVSFRCKREICDVCLGSGWIETGDDAREVPDIIMTLEGYPRWITRVIPSR